MREIGRAPDTLRPVKMEIGVNKYAEGSCLIEFGDTHVLCTASVESYVPAWLKGTNSGWISAEYGMLPRSTSDRMEREARKGQTSRTHEIQRFIGRALRSAIDLRAMGEVAFRVDCDVLQADGGTRTASVTGGFVALYLALKKMSEAKVVRHFPIVDTVAAISCGLRNGEPIMDLDFEEDSSADVDANFVITGQGNLVDIQSTGERRPFTEAEFMKLLSFARKGTGELCTLQRHVLGIK